MRAPLPSRGGRRCIGGGSVKTTRLGANGCARGSVVRCFFAAVTLGMLGCGPQATSPSGEETLVQPASTASDAAGGSTTAPTADASSPGATETPDTHQTAAPAQPSGSSARTATTPSTNPTPIPAPGASHPPAPGAGPLGVETTCDGVDDDANGVVDDVDLAQDGVCDCLKIATLGLHGEWGEGDVLTDWLPTYADGTVTALDLDELTEETLAPFHVLLVRDISANHNPGLGVPSAAAAALLAWVRNGGGLMTVIGYSDATEVGNVNQLLMPFSLAYETEAIVAGSGAAVPVTGWHEHPLTAGIQQVGADNGYPVSGQGAPIATEAGYDVGKAVTIGDGHVLAWGDEWITYAGEWMGSDSYQVDRFWKNSLRWLTRATACQPPGE